MHTDIDIFSYMYVFINPFIYHYLLLFLSLFCLCGRSGVSLSIFVSSVLRSASIYLSIFLSLSLFPAELVVTTPFNDTLT